MKLSDAKKDYYRKLAKDKGYRSRSAYKLEQMNDSYHIFRPSDRVIDLGCAPGGWLQITRKEVGSSGKVVGIDLQEVKPIEGATILRHDIGDHRIVERILTVPEFQGGRSVIRPCTEHQWNLGNRSCQTNLTRPKRVRCCGEGIKEGRCCNFQGI